MFWRRHIDERLEKVEIDLTQTRKWVVQLEADLQAERKARVDLERAFHAELDAHLEQIRLLRDGLAEAGRQVAQLETRAACSAGQPSLRAELRALFHLCAESLAEPKR